MSISKAVLPIAGLGTRFLPVTKVIPKEMLPLNGKPILQILIEEAFECGISEIVLIINKEKEPIIRSYLSLDTPTSKKMAWSLVGFFYGYDDFFSRVTMPKNN